MYTGKNLDLTKHELVEYYLCFYQHFRHIKTLSSKAIEISSRSGEQCPLQVHKNNNKRTNQ